MKSNDLLHLHQHSYNTRNPSFHNSLKAVETKPSYVGIKYFSRLPPKCQRDCRYEQIKERTKSTYLYTVITNHQTSCDSFKSYSNIIFILSPVLFVNLALPNLTPSTRPGHQGADLELMTTGPMPHMVNGTGNEGK